MKSLIRRIYHAFGPIGLGLLLDSIDLATFGPVGFILGPIIGAYLGWLIAEFENATRNTKILAAFVCAVYFAAPFTEPIPIATLLVVILRFIRFQNNENTTTPK